MDLFRRGVGVVLTFVGGRRVEGVGICEYEYISE